jgi:hypothetical protein
VTTDKEPSTTTRSVTRARRIRTVQFPAEGNGRDAVLLHPEGSSQVAVVVSPERVHARR